MKLRNAIAIGLVGSAPVLELGNEAHAETPQPAAPWVIEAARPPSDLTLPLALRGTPAATRLLLMPETTTAATREIRLSPGAKTAIIVTAVVVGVLIIAGIVAVGHPHHPF